MIRRILGAFTRRRIPGERAADLENLQVNDQPIRGRNCVCIAPLGEGAFGKVWRVRFDGIYLAFKFIRLSNRFAAREFYAIQLIRELKPENLIQIHQVLFLDHNRNIMEDSAVYESVDRSRFPAGFSPTWLVIGMEVAESSLKQLVRKHRKESGTGMNASRGLKYLLDVAQALDQLNYPRRFGKNYPPIVHCDVKPANILINSGGAKLTDFGVSRSLYDKRRERTTIGTPHYASPECIVDRQPSQESDQYSLAISAYYVLTGRLPFPESILQDVEAVENCHRYGHLEFNDVDLRLRPVFEKATSNKRYENSVAFVQALQHLSRPSDNASDAVEELLHDDTLGEITPDPSFEMVEPESRTSDTKSVFSGHDNEDWNSEFDEHALKQNEQNDWERAEFDSFDDTSLTANDSGVSTGPKYGSRSDEGDDDRTGLHWATKLAFGSFAASVLVLVVLAIVQFAKREPQEEWSLPNGDKSTGEYWEGLREELKTSEDDSNRLKVSREAVWNYLVGQLDSWDSLNKYTSDENERQRESIGRIIDDHFEESLYGDIRSLSEWYDGLAQARKQERGKLKSLMDYEQLAKVAGIDNQNVVSDLKTTAKWLRSLNEVASRPPEIAQNPWFSREDAISYFDATCGTKWLENLTKAHAFATEADETFAGQVDLTGMLSKATRIKAHDEIVKRLALESSPKLDRAVYDVLDDELEGKTQYHKRILHLFRSNLGRVISKRYEAEIDKILVCEFGTNSWLVFSTTVWKEKLGTKSSQLSEEIHDAAELLEKLNSPASTRVKAYSQFLKSDYLVSAAKFKKAAKEDSESYREECNLMGLVAKYMQATAEYNSQPQPDKENYFAKLRKIRQDLEQYEFSNNNELINAWKDCLLSVNRVDLDHKKLLEAMRENLGESRETFPD